MKASEIEIGAVYRTTVTGKEAHVRIEREHERGGWVGTNLQTKRSVRVQSARRLRSRVAQPADDAGVAKTVEAVEQGDLAVGITVPRRRARKRLSPKERQALQAQSKADQANARLREEREGSPDGMAATSGGERAMAESEPAKAGRQSPRPKKSKKTGCLDAAVRVLEGVGAPLTCGQMMERILAQGLWTTAGRTPAATLCSAILREIQRRGGDARFVLAERGKFQLNR